MTDENSNDNLQEEKPAEFYREKDVFGLEKPIEPLQEDKKKFQDEKKEQVSEVFIPGAPYSEYQSVKNFCILTIFSFGFYELIWFYRHWRYLRYEKHLNIMPALRATSTIFVGYSLFRKFYKLAVEKGYNKKPALFLLFTSYIILSLFAFFPDISFIALLSFIPLLPVLKMMNFYYLKEQENHNIRKKLSKGEKRFLLIFWTVMFVWIYLYWSQPAMEQSNYFILSGDE